jgi:hypothetical protein
MPAFLNIVFVFVSIAPICIGCQKTTVPGDQSDVPADHSNASTVSPKEAKSWLETGLPELSEEVADAPLKLFNAKIEHNEFEQELLAVSYERPKVVQTMAAQVTLVLLPITGGRHEVYVPNGILIQPQSEGMINGITDQLLNHRGYVSSGIRAYLEMRAATINGPGQRPIRVSEVCWIGSNEQLASAVKQYPSGPSIDTGEQRTALKPVPTGQLFKGTPLWMKCGDRWTRGYAIADTDGEAVQLLLFLVRRDHPYMPWELKAARSDLRIEDSALREFSQDPHSFQDLADSVDSRLSRMGAPKKLQHVQVNNLPVDTPVLDFWNGMLDPCRVVGETKDGVTPIKRVGLDNAEMSKPTKDLFLDPLATP